MQKVGIIGGSGFIGSHITKKFLEENYKVRVSATDLSNKEKYQHLRNFTSSGNLELFQLNTQNDNELKEFVNGCDILVHCGTPFQLDVADVQKDLLDPTIKGTENFLKVVSGSPEVKKVIIVASVAAINPSFPFPAAENLPDHLYAETDVPVVNEMTHPYSQAKYYADQMVRNFIRDNPALDTEIISVFPTFVVGNQLSDRKDSTSAGMQFLIKNKLSPNPFMEAVFQYDIAFAMVDVRDVAQSIYRAATLTGLHGRNYLLTSESWAVSDISLMLNSRPPEGKSKMIYSNTKARTELGIAFNPPQVALNEFI
ncbi:MAG TPA: NAD-dependent epimerase/dehydratase family protein [Flavisolibacter sp.]|nr:NAD-dependent epimerase/dehydratase family protein [Flavisolibacter sp.]